MKQRIRNLLFFKKTDLVKKNIASYLKNGRIPWSKGYVEYKNKYIAECICSVEILANFQNKILPNNFGFGLDERSVEYPWIFSKLSSNKNIILDAGSTFNTDFIVEHPKIKQKNLTIYTFFPEEDCFFSNKINYVFGDLRDLYFKDQTFDEIVSQSTIEHIDMDNSMYGYSAKNTKNEKSYEYIKALKEMVRVFKPGGQLLVTFPYGKYEYHGFFQQFDKEMLQKIVGLFKQEGQIEIDYFKYEKTGWRFAVNEDLSQIESYNPHTGRGKFDDGAAHSRSIACIEFIKNK